MKLDDFIEKVVGNEFENYRKSYVGEYRMAFEDFMLSKGIGVQFNYIFTEKGVVWKYFICTASSDWETVYSNEHPSRDTLTMDAYVNMLELLSGKLKLKDVQ